ncbi:uncharacterized protein LOC117643081 isoform X2 [Thrips palmi]|uniref:Uncharacterized protein LOC117643081 isoform X2 n=1 Tax=Thrips palmi TaxID=161013 RepID=A0A6P8ZKS8_THRPL|nr:uncharacterized protein LOC117643081 isoform X2 [Thrips palmi]
MASCDWGAWECHPDLEQEWKLFVQECQKSAKSDLTSDLWMNFWRSESPPSNDLPHPDCLEILDPVHRAEANTLPKDSPTVHVEEEINSKAADVALTDSQLQQINSVALELADILDMQCDSIPDDLKDCLCSLPANGMTALLMELESQLTNQKAYNFCSLLCEETAEGPCINVALVFEILFLPMLTGNSLENLSEEVKAGLIKMSDHFPSECVSHLLMPLLAHEVTSPSLLELLSALIQPLSETDCYSLMRYFVQQCSAPIEEWRISVLNCILSKARPSSLEGKAESSLLIGLLPILTASSRALSTSELFASLLLKVIPALKCCSSTRVHGELATIVQENKSFNKKALSDALKSLGS